MKKSFPVFMVICLLLSSFILARKGAAYVNASGERNENLPVIVVDAGHGGNDPGKIGINQACEKDINLSIAQKLKPLLENKKYKVLLTRESDKTLAGSSSPNKKIEDLQKRVQLISSSHAVLTISIHQNSYTDESVYGPQVFYYSQSKEGKAIAECVQESLNTCLEVQSPRICKANDNYYLLKKTPTPTIIVECGFLSNAAEAAKLLDDDYQNRVSRAIFLGISSYYSKNPTM